MASFRSTDKISECARTRLPALTLKADEDAPLKTLVAVWDALTRSGFRVKDVPARILIQKPANQGAP